MDKAHIFQKLQGIIASILEIDPAEITLDSSLLDDLGIESVDLVDITTKMEQAFNFEIESGELWNFGSFFSENTNFIDGKLTKQGVNSVRKCFAGEFPGLEAGTSLFDFFSMVTVKTLFDFVVKKLMM